MPDIYVAKDKRKKEAKTHPVKRRKAKKPFVPKAETVAERLKTRRTTNPLASLIFRPRKLTFETQEKEEKLILLARRHVVTNLRWVLIAVTMFFLPWVVLAVFPQIFQALPFRSVVILAWYLFTFSYAFEHFLKWFFDVNIITDERVVDIDFPFILYRDISSTKIDNIQDVSAKTGGFARAIFDYGDVHIQTAGEQREFIFEAVPQPDEVIRVLNQLILEEEQEKIEGRVR